MLLVASMWKRLWLGAGCLVAAIALAPVVGVALVNPNDFCTGNPCQITSNKTADPDIVLDFGPRTVVLTAILTIGKRPVTNRVGNLTIRAGSFAITGNGQIDGSGGSAPAGSLLIETTGNIQVDGTRATGAFRFPGTDAGSVFLVADGDIYGAGRFNLSNSSISGGGGEIVLSAGGAINLTGQINANGGAQGFGGTLDFSAGQNMFVTGGINISGGEVGGGSMDAFAGGDIRLGSLDISAGGDAGDGGLANLLALGSLRINGGIVGHGAHNGENCGDAGELDLAADGDIFVNASIEMRGRGRDCSGGSVTIDGAAVQISALIDLSSTGTEGLGGDVDFSASSTLIIANTVRTDGADGGGDVLISSDGNISLGGTIRAEGRGTFGAGASLVDIDSGGTLAMSGSIMAFGGSLGQGGDVAFNGCTVFQTSLSTIDVRSAGGQITVRGNDSLTLQGRFFGEPTTEDPIAIQYRASGPPPAIGSATFNVAPTLIASPTIAPCALCNSDAECDDGNPCTANTCIPATGCSNPAISGPCDDGNACTTNDFCAFSLCLSVTPVVCDDGNPCTDNSCNPATGCQSVPNSAACDDGDACTLQDTCAGGICTGNPIDCSDGNPCTDNACVGGNCVSTDNTAPCEDGDACTVGDVCNGGNCQSGAPAVCDDADPCTTDSCSSAAGCVHTPIDQCTESDADNDGIPDLEDVCTTRAWSAPPVSPPDQHPLRTRLNLTKLTKPRGEQGIVFAGWFNPAAPPLPMQPELDGIHFAVSDSAGALYDIDVPGGLVGEPQHCGTRDGWTTAPGRKPRWKYDNRSGALPPGCVAGSARGLSSVQLKDLRSSSRAAIQFKVLVKKTTIDHVPAIPPTRLQANLALAARPEPGTASAAAMAGQCAEAVIAGNPIAAASPRPFCNQRLRNGFIEKLVCQGP